MKVSGVFTDGSMTKRAPTVPMWVFSRGHVRCSLHATSAKLRVAAVASHSVEQNTHTPQTLHVREVSTLQPRQRAPPPWPCHSIATGGTGGG